MSHLFRNLAALDAGVPGKDGVVGNTTNSNSATFLNVDLDGATGMAEAAKRKMS
jgi:hypothetical protein